MSLDAPQGDLDVEANVWTPERIRAVERNLESGGHVVVQTVVRDAGGRLAGYTILHATPRGYAIQEDTFVHADFRGNRLGAWIKWANLTLLLTRLPDTGRIHTWSATENAAMLAINHEFGFVPSGTDAAWQLRLG